MATFQERLVQALLGPRQQDDTLVAPPRNPARLPDAWEAGITEAVVGPVQDMGRALSGQMTEPEAQDFAFGAAMGVLPMRRAAGAVAKGIRAYHGSPHDFDRFDLSRIGTGEGAQAYGHGLYFAEAEPVAKQYRDALSAAQSGPEWTASKILALHGGDVSAAINYAAKKVDDAYARGDMDAAQRSLAIKARLASTDALPNPQGRMYEVNINAHPDQFLDWDKPLSKQPSAAQDILRLPPTAAKINDTLISRGHPEMTGGNAYTEIRAAAPDKGQAWLTDRFREAGIPGIKYLDQGSRSAGEGSRNYVVFDDKLIDILRKYGLAGAAPSTALLAEALLAKPKAEAHQ